MYIPVAGSVIIESYSKLSMVTTLAKFFKAQPRSLCVPLHKPGQMPIVVLVTI